MIRPGRHQTLGLALLCAVQFMLVLDITVVNVALPSIQAALSFSEADIHWVVSAYAAAFGGFLLVGGRIADVVGRKKMYVAGVVVFTTCSLACGLAWSDGALIAARTLQGVGAALISPAALAILATTFPEGRRRARALGLWGSVGAFAAATGLLLGGVFVELLSWHWIFLTNIPLGVVALLAAPRLLSESRSDRGVSLDWRGGVLITGGVVAFVLALAQAGESGLAAPATMASAGIGLTLLTAFAFRIRRVRDPLVPPWFFRNRSVAGANLVGFVHGAMMLATFLLLSIAMQQVLGYSAISTGLGLLAVRGTSIVWAQVAARLMARIGARFVLVVGIVAMTAGLASFTRLSPQGSYAVDLLPGLLVIGLAIPFLFVSISALALDGVEGADTGLASGLLSSSQWIGGASGIALVSAIVAAAGGIEAVSQTDSQALADALAAGFRACVWLGTGGLLIALFLLRQGLRR